MAPPAKRRKRAIVESDDDEYMDNGPQQKAEHQYKDNTLTRFLSLSPEKKPPSTTASVPVDPSSPQPRKRAAAAVKTTKATTRSPNTSPIKTRTRATQQRKRKAGDDDKEKGGKSGNLLTLFSQQAQRSQSSLHSNGHGTTKTNKTAKAIVDDIISDPISVSDKDDIIDDDDDNIPLIRSSATAAPSSLASRAKAAQKRFASTAPSNTQQTSTQSAAGTLSSNTGGRRFLRPAPRSNGSQSSTLASTPATIPDGNDSRPWPERFAPADLDELAVHKRKVQDVRRWLDDVFSNRLRQRLLVLKGPAGSGKTTTVRLLARDMHCEVLEWRNPASSFGAVGMAGYQSAAAQFEEFLGRGGKFGQLDLEDEEESPLPPASSSATAAAGSGSGSEKKLILIEEFPNTFMRSSTGLIAFRSAVMQYLEANTPPMASFGFGQPAGPITPIVMVVSETLLTTTSASADSFTAHRLLGPEILRHPGTGVIEFNPIAPTFMTKALELVVQKEARKSGRKRTPGPAVLQRLAEIGDIRNAISSLEFLCLKGDHEADWGSKVGFSRPKRGAKDLPALTKGEQESLELVSQREATLGIFHAVGKVVYNKREEFPSGSVEEQTERTLPPYMVHLARPKRSEVAVDSLMDEIGTDTHTFISALHENYALSCEQTGPMDPNSSLDYLNGCLDYLSDSDMLCPSWDVFFGGRGGFAGNAGYYGKDMGSHILRQDEMAFQVAVRGLLFSLPSPVKRLAHPTGRGGDAFKMFYPTYLKLWRTKEEIEGLVDVWATKMLKGEVGGPGPPPSQHSQLTGSSAFLFKSPSKRFPNTALAHHPKPQPPTVVTAVTSDHVRHSQPPPPLSLGTAARQELLLERLPYMTHIARRRRTYGTTHTRELERIVSFHGIGTLGAGEEEGEEAIADEEATGTGLVAGSVSEVVSWATDRPVEEPPPRKKGGLVSILRGGDDGVGCLSMQGLVISDDDIEDD